jgi:hypothetical protein
MDPSLSTTTRPSAPSLPWVSDPRAQALLTYLQIAYPIALLIIFIVAFTVRSILTARNDNDDTPQSDQLGPGGKPLPKKSKKDKSEANALDFSRARKVLFISLQSGVLLSFTGNIALVIFHALLEREQRWWCGQAPTVSNPLRTTRFVPHADQSDLPHRLLHGSRPPTNYTNRH